MFENAIFAGGGSRCVWQLGFWQGAIAAGLPLDQTVSYVASTSAGCAMATAALLGRAQEAVDRFKTLTADNPGNIHCRIQSTVLTGQDQREPASFTAGPTRASRRTNRQSQEFG